MLGKVFKIRTKRRYKSCMLRIRRIHIFVDEIKTYRLSKLFATFPQYHSDNLATKLILWRERESCGTKGSSSLIKHENSKGQSLECDGRLNHMAFTVRITLKID
ncbi:CLUMA_CG000440, isoform A [Clunio marinus]|uniref:CLUMA_CG000440, isoform A n=1 Tax=Clunio marinus TaxID=568069 RepID=A0A1J1HGC0_9DIPT|nr:CLUMA_CG000440, isoform A [Clunio marinus]